MKVAKLVHNEITISLFNKIFVIYGSSVNKELNITIDPKNQKK